MCFSGNETRINFCVFFFLIRKSDLSNGGSVVDTDTEAPLRDNHSSSTTTTMGSKRPVSMFEPREGAHNKSSQQMTESRTTTSMYQMARAIKPKDTLLLPTSEDVKYRTDIVTRCIQDLWMKMQDKTTKDGFVSCAEKIKESVDDLTEIFPMVRNG